MTFFVKVVFQGKIGNFVTFNYPFLIFFLCTTIETVTSMISCQTFFCKLFSFFIFCHVFSYRPTGTIFRMFFLSTVFQKIRIFLSSNFRFAVSFLCKTIETIFRIVLCPNDILKEYFFVFQVAFFLVFLYKPIDAIFRVILLKNGLS